MSEAEDKRPVCNCCTCRPGGPCDEDDDFGSEFALVEGTANDHETLGSNRDLCQRVWAMAKPPEGFSKTKPAATARRLQVTQDLLQGELETGPKAPHPLPTSLDGARFSQSLIQAGLISSSTVWKKSTTSFRNRPPTV